MKRNLVPLLGIAFVVAVASTGIFYGLFVGKLKSSVPPPATFLVVAAHELKAGTVLSAADLKTTPWAGEKTPFGTYGDPSKLVGSTLLGPVADREPILQERISGKDGTSDKTGVPVGMRAVSVHVSDSTGVLSILRPGNKVDVQVVTPKALDPVARTVIQELTVLAVSTTPENASQLGVSAPVVTLLATPADADILALADAAARVRLVLRNSSDEEKVKTGNIALTGLLKGTGAVDVKAAPVSAPLPVKQPETNRPATVGSAPAASPDSDMALSVRFAGTTRAAFEELGRDLVTPGHSGEFQVSAFRSGTQPEVVWKKLQDAKQVDVITASQLMASLNRAVSVEAGSLTAKSDPACGLRIRFAPVRGANGKLRLRVQPEVMSPLGAASGVRRSETEVDFEEGQWFLVSGLTSGRETLALSEKLFPSQAKDPGREFVVLVSPHLSRAVAKN